MFDCRLNCSYMFQSCRWLHDKADHVTCNMLHDKTDHVTKSASQIKVGRLSQTKYNFEKKFMNMCKTIMKVALEKFTV